VSATDAGEATMAASGPWIETGGFFPTRIFSFLPASGQGRRGFSERNDFLFFPPLSSLIELSILLR
jgi:hypothetical protein